MSDDTIVVVACNVAAGVQRLGWCDCVPMTAACMAEALGDPRISSGAPAPLDEVAQLDEFVRVQRRRLPSPFGPEDGP
jgi:hypothetical protein